MPHPASSLPQGLEVAHAKRLCPPGQSEPAVALAIAMIVVVLELVVVGLAVWFCL